MIEPRLNLHRTNCLTQTNILTNDHYKQDFEQDTMHIQDDHHTATGNFPSTSCNQSCND